MTKDCEICGAPVDKPVVADCGHRTFLCIDCRRECPAAMKECMECEDMDHGDDEEISENSYVLERDDPAQQKRGDE